jgi:hypothetical protein
MHGREDERTLLPILLPFLWSLALFAACDLIFREDTGAASGTAIPHDSGRTSSHCRSRSRCGGNICRDDWPNPFGGKRLKSNASVSHVALRLGGA